MNASCLHNDMCQSSLGMVCHGSPSFDGSNLGICLPKAKLGEDCNIDNECHMSNPYCRRESMHTSKTVCCKSSTTLSDDPHPGTSTEYCSDQPVGYTCSFDEMCDYPTNICYDYTNVTSGLCSVKVRKSISLLKLSSRFLYSCPTFKIIINTGTLENC